MSVLNDIISKQSVVMVAGHEVRLRYPDFQTRVRIRQRLEAVNVGEAQNLKASEIESMFGDILLDALCATVVDQDIDREGWSRLISVSNEAPDEYPGLLELCNSAVKMCGVDLKIGEQSSSENSPADEAPKEDPISATDAAIGTDPT